MKQVTFVAALLCASSAYPSSLSNKMTQVLEKITNKPGQTLNAAATDVLAQIGVTYNQGTATRSTLDSSSVFDSVYFNQNATISGNGVFASNGNIVTVYDSNNTTYTAIVSSGGIQQNSVLEFKNSSLSANTGHICLTIRYTGLGLKSTSDIADYLNNWMKPCATISPQTDPVDVYVKNPVNSDFFTLYFNGDNNIVYKPLLFTNSGATITVQDSIGASYTRVSTASTLQHDSVMSFYSTDHTKTLKILYHGPDISGADPTSLAVTVTGKLNAWLNSPQSTISSGISPKDSYAQNVCGNDFSILWSALNVTEGVFSQDTLSLTATVSGTSYTTGISDLPSLSAKYFKDPSNNLLLAIMNSSGSDINSSDLSTKLNTWLASSTSPNGSIVGSQTCIKAELDKVTQALNPGGTIKDSADALEIIRKKIGL